MYNDIKVKESQSQIDFDKGCGYQMRISDYVANYILELLEEKTKMKVWRLNGTNLQIP